MRAIALAVLLPSLAAAQVSVPGTIGYQGRLLKADGTAETGSFQMTFALFPAATGGTALWTETQTVTASNGFYAVSLGQVQPLDPSIFAQPGLYLEVAVGNEQAFSPRMGIQSVPFAVAAGTAGDAEALGGRAPSDYVLAANLAAAGYLTQLDAAATYLSKADAVATYLSLADASLTYLTKAEADLTFLPLGGTAADSAQLGGSPAADYLKRADAAFVQLSPAAPQPGGFSLTGNGDLGGALNVSGQITAGSLAAGDSLFGGTVSVAGPVSASSLTATGLVQGGATAALFGAVAEAAFTPATSSAEEIPGLSATFTLEREALALVSLSGSASNAGSAACQSGLGLRVDGVFGIPESYVQVAPGAGGFGFTAHLFLTKDAHTVAATVSSVVPACLAFCRVTTCRLEVLAVYQ